MFLSCDMEGVAGIVDWSQCRPDGGPAYARGCALMLAEVNAAIDGAMSAGVTEVLVNDSHGAMFNLDPAGLHGRAAYLSGRHKPGYMMEGLDDGFDMVAFVGYHGSISGAPSTLSHTYNPEVISGVRLDGDYVGEAGINALVAHHLGVPIGFVSGDAVTLEETERVAPGAVGVLTKESVTRFAARNLHPEAAREAIRAGAEAAAAKVAAGEVDLPQIQVPARLEIDLQTADMAEVASWVRGVERTDTRTVAITGTSGSDMFRSFVALTYITRQAGGR
jgi:D-amino peptidase